MIDEIMLIAFPLVSSGGRNLTLSTIIVINVFIFDTLYIWTYKTTCKVR
jgi:hypothetical protein